MPTRRGWVITPDRRIAPVPETLLDDEEITWPPGLPEKAPGEPVKYFSADDMYRRYELVPGELYVYLQGNPVRVLNT
jgi:hypothetical protein